MNCDRLWEYNGNECVHKDLFPLHYIDIILTFAVIIFSMLASIAGIGGGGILIPIFILIGNFETKYSLPLSVITIAGNSLGRMLLLIRKRNLENPNKYMIDYKSIFMIVPFDANASFIGFILNEISPDWLVMVTIIIFLGISSYKTFKKGIKQYKLEKSGEEMLLYTDGISYPIQLKEIIIDNLPINIDIKYYENIIKSNYDNKFIKYLFSVIFIFSVISVFSIVRELFNISDYQYWLIYLGQLIIVIPIGIAVSYYNLYYDNDQENTMDYWDKKKVFIYIGIGSLTGLISTYMGIGGGMVLSPILLNIGMRPEVTSATLSVTTFFSAVASSIQFIGTDRFLVYYSVYYFILGFISSLIGLKLFGTIFKKTGKGYVIIFMLGSLITFSAVMLTIINIIEITK